MQLLPAAEDAEAAAALRELEKAPTNYQDAEAEMAQGEQEKALQGYQEAEAPAAEAALRELEKALTNYQSVEAAAARRSVSTRDAPGEKSRSVDPSAHTLVAQGSPINEFRRSGVLTWAEGARRPGVASVRAPCEEVHLRYTREARG